MGLIWIFVAAFWGVAEATVFFFVPDVVLTAGVMKFGFRRALRLAVFAAGSASLAGIGMWMWGAHDAAAARSVMLLVPAIGPDLLARAHSEIAGLWPLHLFVGAITGLPYKLYAIEAGARGINPYLFALVSFPARMVRFVLTMGLTAIAREALSRMQWIRWRYHVLALGWTLFYAVYFSYRAAM